MNCNITTASRKHRKGFVFTIDSMISLLFAFLIISMPAPDYANNYESAVTEASVAALHRQAHLKPTELISHISGMCGEYVIYDENMKITDEGKTCTCEDKRPYSYVYIDGEGRPFLAEIKACAVDKGVE
ncbi:MAG: hypothetical protein N3G76_02840 [Candidatus Micrarchaeota archaeon]|nr:hypothetical protein [Candidatus Micrarchaeota archaeon]